VSLISFFHALAGTVVVSAGVLALSSRKGFALHKHAGRVFVGATLLMGPTLAVQAWLEPGSISVLGGLFVALALYLVVTAWASARDPERGPRVLNYVAPIVALLISVSGFFWGLDAVNSATAPINGPPNEAYFFFATVAFLAMVLDINQLRLGGIRGMHRRIRHIWRMSFALFFATSTLFTGPGAVILPEALRGTSVLLIPQSLVAIVAMYWIYKESIRALWPNRK